MIAHRIVVRSAAALAVCAAPALASEVVEITTTTPGYDDPRYYDVPAT